MQFQITPRETPTKKAGFYITVEYEHGDADMLEESIEYLPSTNLEALASWLGDFKEVASGIYNARNSGEAYYQPSHLEHITLERDAYAKMHMSDYYAEMRYTGIILVNDQQEEFDVAVSRD